MPRQKKRPDGLYERKVVVGERLDGKQIRKSFYGASEKEINRKVEEYRRQSAHGAVDKTITLKAWAQRWLETYKRGTVSESTYSTTYENSVNKHIIPYFKDAKLCAVKSIDVQEFFNSLSLSDSRLKKIKNTLSAIFDSAIENDLVVKNPAKAMRPKSDKTPVEKRAYTKAEVDQLTAYARTHKNGAVIILMLNTGLRRGEVMALRWQDIDFKARVLSVRQSVSEAHGKLLIGTPKTAASVADIPLSKEMCDILALVPRHTVYYTGKKKKRVAHTVKNEYVFANSRGQITAPRNWQLRVYDPFMKDYAAYCESNDLTCRTLLPHELRHTYGSLIYEATNDIYITSKLMRHANISVTAKTYVHETIDKKRDAMSKVFEVLS